MKKISEDDLSREISNSIDKGYFDDARMYLAIATSNNYLIDVKRFKQRIRDEDTRLRKIMTKGKDFKKGFVNGKSTNMAGVAGAVAADFTVIGDARDLKGEYTKFQKGDDVNELIVILSGTGIGLTVLTVATLGGAAPAKVGASVLKVAVKTQTCNARIAKTFSKSGAQYF